MTSPTGSFSGRTAWARNLEPPLREFLRTETGSAAVLLGAAIAALAWVNIDSSSYDRSGTDDPVDQARQRRGRAGPPRLGEQRADGVLLLRRRARGAPRVRHRRAAAAAAAGTAAARRARRDGDAGPDLSRRQRRPPSAHGWGVAMSTDTAFALGMLALVGPRFPDRLRAFMLTVVVVDDIVALLVIATVYTDHVALDALLIAVGLFVRSCSSSGPSASARGLPYAALGARRLGRPVQVRRRPGRGRARDGNPHVRLSGGAHGPRAGERALPPLPRAADAGAGPLRERRGRVRDLAERAAAAALPPLDELRDRAAVRARQHRDRDQRRPAGARLHVADHPGDPDRRTWSASRSASSAPRGS